jgi:FkbM family methyltransferase
MNFLKSKFGNLSLFLNNKYYREFIRLLFKYGSVNRNEIRDIKFLNYNIKVPDCLSFIFQFKEIFVKEYYLFEPISKSPVIFDCGANIGISCIFFKKFFPNAKVKAFEADSSIAEILKNNLEKNSFQDVEVISKAVWIDNDGIEFGAEGSDSGSIYSNKNKIIVPSVRLKDIIEQEKSIDFLKMDIEGAEIKVIEDCDGSLNRVNNIFIEYHSFINKEQELEKILKVLTENQFRYFIKSDVPRTSPFINKLSNITPSMDLQLNIFAYRNFSNA